MDVILGVGVAAGLGLADFFGGMSGRRCGPIRTNTVLPVVASGFLLLLAHALLLEALSQGLLSIVGPITSLSPAFTVVPAWLFLHEHISRTQVVGMVMATAGLVLVALG